MAERNTEPSEAATQKLILEYLKHSGLIYWRQSLGGVKRNGIRAKNPMKGFPDICGVSRGGVFWGMEIKSKKGKCSDEQNEWHNTLEISGAMIFVVRSLEQAISAIKRIKGSK